MSRAVIGQFVTPQKTAAMPTAVQSVGEKPDRFPNRQPNAAPVKNDGTISPPLNPAPNVSSKEHFHKKGFRADRAVNTLFNDIDSRTVIILVAHKQR